MSIFSFLGNVGKTVGKVALGVAKTGITAATGIQLGGGSATGAVPVGSAEGVIIQQPVAPVVQPTIGSSITGLLGAATDFLSGRTHVQADVHTQIGGTNDPYATGVNSGFPSWLLPVGLGAGALFLLSSRGGGRR